jgi:deazaflavin-dependent oxidoreductase (nitroreductase family)
MAYLKPPLVTRRVFNPLAMRTGASGSETLVITGRNTGRPEEVPVIPVDHEGGRYLVSTRGESDWVRNLRAAGTAELRRKGVRQRVRATEVPVEERSLILAAYQAKAGKTVQTYFRRLPDPADHPVFRLEPES